MQDGKEVKSGTILARGANTKISKSVGGVKKSTFSVVISAAGDEEITSTCTYVVSIGSKGLDATTTWSLPDDADAACSGVINMFCNKSYRAGSWSWKTSLVIND